MEKTEDKEKEHNKIVKEKTDTDDNESFDKYRTRSVLIQLSMLMQIMVGVLHHYPAILMKCLQAQRAKEKVR